MKLISTEKKKQNFLKKKKVLVNYLTRHFEKPTANFLSK